MAGPSRYVIAYDLSDDRERLRVAKVLEGFGERVQGSVFECLLDKPAKGRLAAKLRDLELATGFVSLYRLTEHSRPVDIGSVPEDVLRGDLRAGPDDAAYAFVI